MLMDTPESEKCRVKRKNISGLANPDNRKTLQLTDSVTPDIFTEYPVGWITIYIRMYVSLLCVDFSSHLPSARLAV